MSAGSTRSRRSMRACRSAWNRRDSGRVAGLAAGGAGRPSETREGDALRASRPGGADRRDSTAGAAADRQAAGQVGPGAGSARSVNTQKQQHRITLRRLRASTVSPQAGASPTTGDADKRLHQGCVLQRAMNPTKEDLRIAATVWTNGTLISIPGYVARQWVDSAKPLPQIPNSCSCSLGFEAKLAAAELLCSNHSFRDDPTSWLAFGDNE